MTAFQRIIKYLAIGLAIFICITLFSVIVEGAKTLFESLNIIKENEPKYNEVIDYNNEFSYLDINLKSSNLIIKSGNKFSVDTSDKSIKIYNEKNKLKIVDENKKIFVRRIKNFIITIPYNYNFEAVKIEAGAGKVDINGLNTDLLEMELGAGKTLLNNILSNKTFIETGAGNVSISNSRLNDLNLELGVGKIDIIAEITGKSIIESGIGELNLSLNLPISEYNFELEKGIGQIKLNNEVIKNNTNIGEGYNRIRVEGGIGRIDIKTFEE